jgi:hypothetical protein
MPYFDWHTDFEWEMDRRMFVRIMFIIGMATLVLAFIIFARVSHTVPPPLSAKPLGASTLSHGGPSVAPLSRRLPDRPGDSAKDRDREGEKER